MSTITDINNWDSWLVAREAINDNFAALNADKMEETDLGALSLLDTVGTSQIDNDAISNGKLADMLTKTYKGRTAGSTGDPEDVPVATLKTDLNLVKWDVGLGNVDNTSDANKPVSTATQTALDWKANSLWADDNYVTDAEKVKISNLSWTNTGDQTAATVANTPTGNLAANTVQWAVNELQGDIDTINTSLGGLTDAVVLKWAWDASAGTFPWAGIAQAGRSYIVSVAGTVNGVAFALNDRLLAIVDNASTATFASNRHKLDYTDQVLSVAWKIWAVTLDTADVAASTNKNYVTDTQQTLIAAMTASFTTADETKLDAIEALADVTDAWNVGSAIHGSAAKVTSIDADTLALIDSAASNVLKKVTWANVKATLKTYFDTLYQPLSTALTTLAWLTATTDNFIVSVSNAWASRTPAQVRTTLSLNSVDNTSDATKNSATATLTNKRITKRVGTVASSATPTINSDNVDLFTITALAAAITSMTTNLSGTPTDWQNLQIAITDNWTARAITWGATFESSSMILPTTTTISTRLDIFFIWNASKWRCIWVA